MKDKIYPSIKEHTETCKKGGRPFSVSGILKILSVSRSGYFSWLKRKPSKQEIKKIERKIKIQEVYDKSKQNYGSPKIAIILKKEGEVISERTVSNYMQEMEIKAQWVKKWIKPGEEKTFNEKLENILNQNFNPEKPNAVWCTDITYIWTADDGWVYLSSIIDLFSRRIIAWKLSKTMEIKFVLETVELAKRRRNVTEPLILHSDRGIHYTCEKYKNYVKDFIRSYSKKGYPYDNACIEAFHSLIKREWLNRFVITNYEHAKALIFEYIDAWYNTIRIHSHCDFMSPIDYEKKYYEKSLLLAG